MKSESRESVNEFVNVKDIKGMYLYTKDNYVFSYLRVYPFNLDLLSHAERENITNRLAAAFDADRKDWDYCTLPRELDLDMYKGFLKEKRMEEMEALGKKHIIDVMILQATDLSSSGENFEHQHFYKFWKQCNEYVNQAQAEAELRDRLLRFTDMYDSVGIKTDILRDQNIIKLCNLYSNSRSANYDLIGSLVQPDIPFIR